MSRVDVMSAGSVLDGRTEPQVPAEWPYRAMKLDSHEIELTWWEAVPADAPDAVLVSYPDAPWCDGYWARRVSIVELDRDGEFVVLVGRQPDRQTLGELADDLERRAS